MNGPWSASTLVKCTNCLDVSRSLDKNSCPSGTKLFSPRSRADWETFLKSAPPLRAPNWIVDVTRPENGCRIDGADCAPDPMNSDARDTLGLSMRLRWMTADGSPWYLRGSSKYSQPSGDYNANCYMDITGAKSASDVTFNDNNCNYHSKSYYCQPMQFSLKP